MATLAMETFDFGRSLEADFPIAFESRDRSRRAASAGDILAIVRLPGADPRFNEIASPRVSFATDVLDGAAEGRNTLLEQVDAVGPLHSAAVA